MSLFSFFSGRSPKKYGNLLGDAISQSAESFLRPDRLERESHKFLDNGWRFSADRFQVVLIDLFYRQAIAIITEKHPDRAADIQRGLLESMPPYFLSPDFGDGTKRLTGHLQAMIDVKASNSPTQALSLLAARDYFESDPRDFGPEPVLYFLSFAKAFDEVLASFAKEIKLRG